MPNAINVICISTEVSLVPRLQTALERREARVLREAHLDRLVERFEEDTYDIVVLTSSAFSGTEIEGAEILEIVLTQSPSTQLVCLLDPGNIRTARRQLRTGTYEYARMPVSDEELRLLMESAVERRPRLGENKLLKAGRKTRTLGEIIGRSPAMQEVYRQVRQAAATDIPVLILGATGTGKDLVAETIHRQSERRDHSYMAVNMGAMPSELVASELFGHEKGAFTGAVERRVGCFEMADGGTVFLDEIGTVDERVQVSLLRLIEQKKFHRLGGRRLVSSDVRLVAATNADLLELVRDGSFREDLFYRLDVFRITMPPLEERQGDIALLIDEFVRRYNQTFEKDIRGIAPECVSLLEAYSWPGNVRELKNVVQRAVLVCEGEVIMPEHLPPRFGTARTSGTVAAAFGVGMTLNEVEREMILRTLAATNNNRKRTAEMLGISRRALYNRLRKHHID